MSHSCPIWGTEATVERQGNATLEIFDSPRTGGRYAISRRASSLINQDPGSFDTHFKARLTSWLLEQRRLGNPYPRVDDATLQQVKDREGLSVHERSDRLLKAISLRTRYLGQIHAVGHEPQSLFFMAHSESVNSKELKFLLSYLVGQHLLELNRSARHILTVQGHTRLAELEGTNTDSNLAFVAMWFDPSMERAFQEGIKPGVEDAGYEPVRIDRKEHNNKIDDEIIAKLKRARFVVADFTQGNSGARGGVYYEAGFAHGLGIPVMFCCQEDYKDKVHFDTRQYNHILWREPTELRDALARRISAVIGDGPNRRK